MKRGKVTLAVYDLAGRKLATVVNEELPPGRYNITWDCTSAAGTKIARAFTFMCLKRPKLLRAGG